MAWMIVEIVVVAVFLWSFGLVRVSGESMLPVLHDGDVILYTRWGGITEGEIILFEARQLDRQLIKRVDRLEPSRVFVLGDNPEVSEDSRNPEIGWVDLDAVTGRALYRIWPFGKRGPLGGE